MKEGPDNKKLCITLFSCSRGVCFFAVDPKIHDICVHHVEVFVHDQFFFMNFAFKCGEEG